LLKTALDLMGIEAEPTIIDTGDPAIIEIIGETEALLSNQGKPLNALQCIVNVAANQRDEEWRRIMLDAGGYREKRRAEIEERAIEAAQRAAEGAQEIAMDPMNAYERRLVHCVLASRDEVETRSEGDEPYRHVVISKS
jgi:spoIIIJ-associated protein